MTSTIAQAINDTFIDADLSLVSNVLYFDGWTSYDASGGYLIFEGFDGTLYCCEYGSSGSDEHSTNAFLPVAITHEQYAACLVEMANVPSVEE